MSTLLKELSIDDAQVAAKSTRTRLFNIFATARFQLAMAAFAGVVLPGLIRVQFENWADEVLSYDANVWGACVAILAGFLIHRKLTSLPGTAALSNTLPGFVLSYLTVMALFSALRIDFSRTQLVLSMIMVCVLFLALSFIVARLKTQMYGFVPGGRADDLKKIKHAEWVRFSSIKDAERAGSIPIVADFNHAGITRDWERYLAEEAITGRRVFNTKQLTESLEGKVAIDHLSENSFGHLAPDALYAPAKLYVDFILAFLALVLLSPLFLLVAVLIRLDSPGPALFRQQRMGYGGKPFTLYKFRSMRVAPTSAAAGDVQKDMTESDDDRITRIGKLIRRTRIDELPQLLNILLGQMSWIGPRPETLALSAWYEDKIPFYRYRHILRPGITGWAQVKQGHVTSVDDVKEKLEYDFYYVRNFSVWLDILIVMQTVRVIFRGHGAK
ncbi:MAG: sugar transferase [Pseudomonadota bacterium]